MPENTFDIVSKVDLQEVSNAIQQALKEVHTRFDLKDSKSNIEMDGKARDRAALDHVLQGPGALLTNTKPPVCLTIS